MIWRLFCCMDTTSVVLIYAPWSRDRRGVGWRCFVIRDRGGAWWNRFPWAKLNYSTECCYIDEILWRGCPDSGNNNEIVQGSETQNSVRRRDWIVNNISKLVHNEIASTWQRLRKSKFASRRLWQRKAWMNQSDSHVLETSAWPPEGGNATKKLALF